ncbi:MAG: helix-turn-helix domain-containing protein [Anaeromicrobium sp.]|jgi:transcriptional regulator with XRE-family HTH domain|uniref:helix-turn-helix domain-containing protein n=1 Tax=Anaeromicrobium sp. TaxID=1929132 RepID=UPI0025F49347|nr:helix-turn-helix transcriptional regulator [Anaeromicrobium sp.]MCT4595204.1 helix-turn-helix domain-containing protein [Anaeromicrobium sp.]
MLKDKLKGLRQEIKLSQKELAAKIGIGSSTYGSYERGQRIPNKETLEKIADALGCTPEYILGRTDNKELTIVEGNEIPEELRKIGIEYLQVTRDVKKNGFTPEKIRQLKNSLRKMGFSIK